MTRKPPRWLFHGMVSLAVAMLALAVPAGVLAGEFPVASTGDIWFQADHAGFLGSEGEVTEEYYFRVTNNQLSFKPTDDGFAGDIYIEVKFKDAEDAELGKAGHRFEFTVPDQAVAESADHAQLFVMREQLDPRAASVELTLEDMNARKRGLLYMVTGKRKNGKASAPIRHPAFRGQDLGISDLQFAWSVEEEVADSPFSKNGLNVIPNPGRTYGLLQSTMSTYYEVYDLSEEEGPRTYLAYHELVSPDGEMTRSKVDTVDSASGEWIKVMTFDLSTLPTGLYTLRAVVEHPASSRSAVSERKFNLLWKNKFWEMTEQDILDEARVLFSEAEYLKFKDMSSGDRAQFLDHFWRETDPSPNSAHNEVRNEFLRRVDYANRHFGHLGKGMLTDRGRMYIRFGEPDEVERELLPTVDHQLDRRLDEFGDDPSGRLLASHDDMDTRPYEIWTYTRQGTPLFPERETTTSVTGLRFVFVDETGTGHYVMRYASDFIAY